MPQSPTVYFMYACLLQRRLQENVHHEARFASSCCSESWWSKTDLVSQWIYLCPKISTTTLAFAWKWGHWYFLDNCHVDPQLMSQNTMTEGLCTSHLVCCSEAQRITTRENKEYKLHFPNFGFLFRLVKKNWIFTSLAFYVSKNIRSTIAFQIYKISLVLAMLYFLFLWSS